MELQFITHFTDQYSYYDSARMALEGGCRLDSAAHERRNSR